MDPKQDQTESEEQGDSNKRMRTQYDQQESSSLTHEETLETRNNDRSVASTSSDSGLPPSRTDPSSVQNVETSSELDQSSFDDTSNQSMNLDFENVGDLFGDLLASRDSYSSSSHNSSSNLDSDHEHEEEEEEEEGTEAEVILKLKQPKHTFFLLSEVVTREYGYSSPKANPVLFQQRCYGSLMSVKKLELMYKLESHEGCVNSVNFSANGKYLASGSDDLKVVIWDWTVGRPLVKINTNHKKNIFQTKFLDLKGTDLHLATAAKDGQVFYLQVGKDGLRESRKIAQHRGPCHKIAVLKDQPQVFFSAGEDGKVFNNDIRQSKAETVCCVKDRETEVALYSIHCNPLKSHEFCLAGTESVVRVYDQRKSSKPMAKFCPFKATDPSYPLRQATCAVYNYDGSEILASYQENDIYLFDTTKGNGQYVHRYSGHRNIATIKGVNFFGPRSEFVVSGSDCAHVFFWDRKTEAITQFLLADDSGVVNCLEPHPELPFIATSGLDWDVKLWVPSCEEEPLVMKHLAATVKDNIRRHDQAGDGSESQEFQLADWLNSYPFGW